MKRRLFNVAAAVSLLLCVATVGLWVRSRYAIDSVTWRFSKGGSIVAVLNPDYLYVGRRHEISPPTTAMTYASGRVTGPVLPLPSEVRVFEFAGFGYYWHPQVAQVRVPLAAPAIFGLLCAGYFHWRRGRVRQPGICNACGYDLRATPERCPECGAAPGER